MSQPPRLLLADKPLRLLFLAINHYVSTGDNIGEGVAYEMDTGEVLVSVPVRVDLAVDQSDWHALVARIRQAPGGMKLRIKNLGPSFGGGHQFTLYGLVMPRSSVEPLTEFLMDEPGPLGWGSVRETVIKSIIVHPPHDDSQN